MLEMTKWALQTYGKDSIWLKWIRTWWTHWMSGRRYSITQRIQIKVSRSSSVTLLYSIGTLEKYQSSTDLSQERLLLLLKILEESMLNGVVSYLMTLKLRWRNGLIQVNPHLRKLLKSTSWTTRFSMSTHVAELLNQANKWNLMSSTIQRRWNSIIFKHSFK